MVIYKTTNLLNNKIYIGKDVYNKSNYLGSGKYLKLAIKKYGNNNFKKEIIETVTNKIELSEREKYWIKKYNSSNKKYGYNLTDGGTGGRTHSKKVWQYDLQGNFIKEWNTITDASTQLNIDHRSISKAMNSKLLSAGGFQWKKEKNKLTTKYHNNKNQSIIQLDMDGNQLKIWDSIKSITKELGINGGNIIKVCDGIGYYKSCGGYKWKRNN